MEKKAFIEPEVEGDEVPPPGTPGVLPCRRGWADPSGDSDEGPAEGDDPPGSHSPPPNVSGADVRREAASLGYILTCPDCPACGLCHARHAGAGRKSHPEHDYPHGR